MYASNADVIDQATQGDALRATGATRADRSPMLASGMPMIGAPSPYSRRPVAISRQGALVRAGPTGDPEPALRGRRREGQALDRLLERVRAGQSGVLVLRGESGVGTSALLEYLVGRASGYRIARAAGVESEMELAAAG